MFHSHSRHSSVSDRNSRNLTAPAFHILSRTVLAPELSHVQNRPEQHPHPSVAQKTASVLQFLSSHSLNCNKDISTHVIGQNSFRSSLPFTRFSFFCCGCATFAFLLLHIHTICNEKPKKKFMKRKHLT